MLCTYYVKTDILKLNILLIRYLNIMNYRKYNTVLIDIFLV